jgi:hypothetical protein
MRDTLSLAARHLALAYVAVAGGALPALAQSAPASPATSPAGRELPPASTTPPNAPAQPTMQPGFSLNDNGGNYHVGDFTWTFWGYGERIFNPGNGSKDYWRRVRQGSEIDLPRVTTGLRPAIVYEVDLTDSAFGRNGFGGRQGYGRRNFENLFIALQDAENATKLRGLIGENTHILSREDNLSSGNLTTVNRSLILEEHNGAGIFGSQFGIEYGMALSPQWSIGIAALDNRGSFNRDQPQYTIGKSFSAKLSGTPIDDAEHGRKLTFGLGVDHTRGVQDRTFPLLTATLQNQIGGFQVSGTKATFEADVAYTFPALFSKPATVEAEGIYSHFGGGTDVGGAYAMLSHQVFSAERLGELDLFARYDFVSASTAAFSGSAFQQAARLGANYNLPYAQRRVNFHTEYAHNRATGPAGIVQSRGSDEFILELRFSLQPYIRH